MAELVWHLVAIFTVGLLTVGAYRAYAHLPSRERHLVAALWAFGCMGIVYGLLIYDTGLIREMHIWKALGVAVGGYVAGSVVSVRK